MLASLLVALIRVYQATLSKVILALAGPVCRFQPSCSRYAIACIQGHGALRGSLLSVKRLCRCHPLHPGGYDPPPPPRSRAEIGPQPLDDGAASGSAPPDHAPTRRDDLGSDATSGADVAAPRSSTPRTTPSPITSVAAATPAPVSATSSATAHLAPEGAGG